MSANEEPPATLPEKLSTGDAADPQPQTLESLLKKDEERLEVLRKKIRSFLVSALALGAVATVLAFLSSLSLPRSQAQIIPDLTSETASQHHPDSPCPDIITMDTLLSFSPFGSLISVLAFWDSSIFVSLATAHIAVGSLRRIGGYDFYENHWTTTEIVAVRKKRYESFNGWFVNHISKGLFLLLLASSILFCVGLIDFFVYIRSLA